MGAGVAFEVPEDRWGQIRMALLAVCVAAYCWWFVEHGVIIDRIAVIVSIALFFVVGSVGRPSSHWRRTSGDVAVIALMWLAYDESRGIADGLGFPIQVESVRNLDRWLFLGVDPPVWLQDRFLGEPGVVRWYDIVGSMVYYSHFVVVPAVLVALWSVSRQQWVRFMRRLATVLFASCAMFVVLPTAPPWMASGGGNSLGLELDALPPLRRPTGNGWRHIGLDGFVTSWDHGRDWSNQVAAMPSLHAAFSLMVAAFFFPWVRDRRLRAVMLAYPASMAIALTYFGEHYVVDSIAGWSLVGASFWVWNRFEQRHRTGPDLDEVDEEPSHVRVGRVAGDEARPASTRPAEQSVPC